MNFVKEYEELTMGDKEKFKRIVNKLFAYTFICRNKESDKNDYYFIDNNKVIFEDYFAYANFELILDESYKVAQLVNTEGQNRVQFKMYESILLLILRLLFHEKMADLTLTNNIFVTLDEIHRKYDMLKISDKQIDITTLKSAIRTLKRFNIIDPLDSDFKDSETRIIIYPTILLAVKSEDIREVYDKLEVYRKSKEVGEEDDAETEED